MTTRYLPFIIFPPSPNVGALYINDCPVDMLIPIWLIVLGSMGLLQVAINIIKTSVKACKGGTGSNLWYIYLGSICQTIMSVFHFVWLLVGTVIVFSLFASFKANDCMHASSGDPHCCNPVPYLFSFTILATMYSLIGVVVTISCIACCIMAC